MEDKKQPIMEYVPWGATDKIKLSLEIVKNFVAVPTKSGAVPNPRDCMKFIMLCQAQRLNPFAGDAYLVGYDAKDGPQFSLLTAHQALLKRAETSPDFEGMESGVILLVDGKTEDREGDFHLPEEKVVGGWAKVYRKGRRPTVQRLALNQRKPSYPTRFWDAAHEAEQITKCAEAAALRATFPTLIGGLHIGQEVTSGSSTEMPLPSAAVSNAEVVTDAPRGAATAVDTEVAPPDTAPQNSPQAELEKLVSESGHTFDDFRRWLAETGNHDDPSSLSGFADVPSALAKRLVRASTGLLRGLAAAKGGQS